ncbi:MAG: hypothetical protein ACOCUV_00145 [bacterium]
MDAANRVAKNTGILYIKMGISVFASLYATRLLLIALGASDYGLFELIGGTITMFTFLNGAMAGASQRFISYAMGGGKSITVKSIFSVSTVLHLIIAILIVIILEIVGIFIFDSLLNIDEDRVKVAEIIYHFLVLSTFITVIEVPLTAVIIAHENLLFDSIIQIIRTFGRLLIAFIILNYRNDRLLLYGILMAALTIFLFLIKLFYCQKKYQEVHFDTRRYFDKLIFKDMSSFAGWSLLGSASTMFSSYGQGIVLNMFFGTKTNAAHGITQQISGQLGSLAWAFTKAISPSIDKSEGAGNRGLMHKIAFIGSKIPFYINLLLFVPMIIEAPYILGVWLDEVPEYTVIFCRIFLLINLYDTIFLTLSSAIRAVGNIKSYQIFISILSILPLIVTYILFKYNFPPQTLFYLFLIYSLLRSVLVMYFSGKNCNISIRQFIIKSMLPSMLIFVLTFLVTLTPVFLIQEGLVRLIIVLIINFFVVLVLVLSFGVTYDEKQVLYNSVRYFYRFMIKRIR